MITKGIKLLLTTICYLCIHHINSQETLPIYQDYLSDNVFLVHPAAAGVGTCAKIRLTARTQWLNIEDAPELQTASFHSRISDDSKAGYGIVLFNDANGYHSQKAIQGTYAYHLALDQNTVFNQLSFGLSFTGILNNIDQRSFTNDPVVNQVLESNFYFNSDFGIAYHRGGLATYVTLKNIFLSAKNNLTSEFDALNLKNYILGASYFLKQNKNIQLEPSFMFQYKEHTAEKMLDLNIKLYKRVKRALFWGAISYRRSFDGSIYEEASYISPILGMSLNNFSGSYTYTHQLNKTTLTEGGFHQFSLGYDLFCREPRLSACPNINGHLF